MGVACAEEKPRAIQKEGEGWFPPPKCRGQWGQHCNLYDLETGALWAFHFYLLWRKMQGCVSRWDRWCQLFGKWSQVCHSLFARWLLMHLSSWGLSLVAGRIGSMGSGWPRWQELNLVNLHTHSTQHGAWHKVVAQEMSVGWMNIWMDGCTFAWMDGWMDEW